MEVSNRVGEEYKNNYGECYKIIEYINSRNCSVMFENGYVKNHGYKQISSGKVINPFSKTCFGVGFTGEGHYSNKLNKRAHQTWRNMIRRCYTKSQQLKQPTYKDVTVCEDWHNFQVFAKWYEENYVEGWELDKDILCTECKIYSPETCCFVPQEINVLLVKSDKTRGKYPIGVYMRKDGAYVSQMYIRDRHKYIGAYKTPEEAFQAYKRVKEQHIKDIIKPYKGLLDKKVYKKLYEYKINIDD